MNRPCSARAGSPEGLDHCPDAQDSFDFSEARDHLPGIEAPWQRERRCKSPRPHLGFFKSFPFHAGRSDTRVVARLWAAR